jgi:hypothetical protein
MVSHVIDLVYFYAAFEMCARLWHSVENTLTFYTRFIISVHEMHRHERGVFYPNISQHVTDFT